MMTTAYEQSIETMENAAGQKKEDGWMPEQPAAEMTEPTHLQRARQSMNDYQQAVDAWGQCEMSEIAYRQAMMHAAYAEAEAATRQAEVAESMLEYAADLIGGTDLINALLQWGYKQDMG